MITGHKFQIYAIVLRETKLNCQMLYTQIFALIFKRCEFILNQINAMARLYLLYSVILILTVVTKFWTGRGHCK